MFCRQSDALRLCSLNYDVNSKGMFVHSSGLGLFDIKCIGVLEIFHPIVCKFTSPCNSPCFLIDLCECVFTL